jgi:plasmid stabilization system protein ParE
LEHFKKEFEQAIKLISENPKGYSYVTGNSPIRKKLQWKYWYFYIELLEEILILRIFHTSED